MIDFLCVLTQKINVILYDLDLIIWCVSRDNVQMLSYQIISLHTPVCGTDEQTLAGQLRTKEQRRGLRNNEIIANRFRATPMKSDQNFPKKMHPMLEKELCSSHAICTAAGMLMFLKEQDLYLLWGVRACVTM